MLQETWDDFQRQLEARQISKNIQWCCIAYFKGTELNPGYDTALSSKIWKQKVETPGTILEISQIQICSVYGLN